MQGHFMAALFEWLDPTNVQGAAVRRLCTGRVDVTTTVHTIEMSTTEHKHLYLANNY
jgi:hypothetical protein